MALSARNWSPSWAPSPTSDFSPSPSPTILPVTLPAWNTTETEISLGSPTLSLPSLNDSASVAASPTFPPVGDETDWSFASLFSSNEFQPLSSEPTVSGAVADDGDSLVVDPVDPELHEVIMQWFQSEMTREPLSPSHVQTSQLQQIQSQTPSCMSNVCELVSWRPSPPRIIRHFPHPSVRARHPETGMMDGEKCGARGCTRIADVELCCLRPDCPTAPTVFEQPGFGYGGPSPSRRKLNVFIMCHQCQNR